jgi:hypothetical protein
VVDLTPQLLDTKSWNPDILLNGGVGTPVYLIIKQAYDIGLVPAVPMLVSYDLPVRTEYWKNLGDKGNYLVFIIYYHQTMKLSGRGETFRQKYLEQFKDMKMINWSMGEFYMIGSYVQHMLLATLLGPERWYMALPLAMGTVFCLGLVIQRFLLRPMFVGAIERRDEYATIVIIALMVFFRSLAIVLGGPNQYAPRDYARPQVLWTLPISGNRFVALIAS